MSWLQTNTLSAFLLPPLNLLLLLILGMGLLKTRPQLGRGLLWLAIITLWLIATPLVSRSLLQLLEHDFAFNPKTSNAQAIIILGAGRYSNAPKYGQDTISGYALERTRYAARLARSTGLPILSSGGNPEGTAISEAMLMKTVLEQEFHVPVRWIEDKSNNTADEARECWRILAPQGITKVALVTHAWHITRAQQAFIKSGFEVTPVPIGFATQPPFSILQLLPNTEALHQSKRALHEWIGLAWYKLRGSN